MNSTMLLILFVIILAVALAMFFYISQSGRGRSTLNRAEFQQRWQRIEQLKSQGNTGWQLAIIEADKLLDQALKQAGHPGETMGDRLKGARNTFRDTDGIWQAHKLRNRLAHEHDIHINQFVIDRALGQLKSGLKDLGAL